jgi:tetratricopeptide (TPR) repeat protein
MPLIIILIIILGASIGIVAYFLIKSIIAPKKMETLFKNLEQGKSGAVTRTAKQILAKNPKNLDAHYLLGMAYLKQNKPELALMELKTVNQIGVFDGYTQEKEFRRQIGELFERFNQPEEALKEYLLLIKLEPNNAEYYYKAGNLFEARDKADKAKNYYRRAIKLDPNHSEAHYRLGYVLYRSKSTVEAKKEFELAIKEEPANYKAYYYLGRLQKEEHNYTAALTSLERAQRDPDFKIKTLIERGTCYMHMKQFDNAITELQRAIKLSSDEQSQETLYARYFLSLNLEKERRFDEAIEQWETIYKKKPGFKDVAEKLSQYQDLRADDHIKDYLTVGPSEFHELCKAVTTQQLGLQIRDTADIKNGCQVLAVESNARWRNARKMPKLVWFLRIPESIDEDTIRSMHEELRKSNIGRGVIVSSSGFSRKAIDYAESRPIELMGNDQLQKLLRSIDLTELTAT